MIIGIIPARYASTRFPGKPLIDIQGKSMIQRVFEQAQQSSRLNAIYIATENEQIAQHCETFGAKVIMTSPLHQSGTDRCLEAAAKIGILEDEKDKTIILNIQGDEPFIDPSQIDLLSSIASQPEVQIATLAIAIDSEELLFSEGEVKITLDKHSNALYFSRSPIPYLKSVKKSEWIKQHNYYRHVGMYAYRYSTLKTIGSLPVSALETAESLEQLRWLENGLKIKIGITQHDSHCIHQPADVERVIQMLLRKPTV